MLELERFFGITEFAKDAETRIAASSAGLPDEDDAKATLLEVCEVEQTRLEALRRELWETVDTPSQLRALDLAAFDDSKAATLRLRYEGASRSDLHRAIEQVRKSRRARDGEPVDAARNEPNEAESPAPEVVEETAVPEEVPADPGPPPAVKPVAAPAPSVRVAVASGPARNEANESEGWDADDAALMAELDAMEVEMAGLEAHVDGLCRV